MKAPIVCFALAGLAGLALLASCATPPAPAAPPAASAASPRAELGYAIGADLSFLQQAEERGTKFKDGGLEKPGLQIFRDHGYNWIRLRLFHTPTQLPNNLAYTIAAAKAAKALGYKFLLNYHYSDTWADPAKQTLPKAWEGKSHAELVKAVFEYTRDTIAAFREAGAMPDMVQNGNEITPGMLWPDGRLPQNWDNFADLVKAGITGVEAGRGGAPRPLIMVQIEKSGNVAATKYFFDNLLKRGVEFDVIGQSYYPWWHGSLLELKECLAFMAEAYRKDIVLVEVAYNWRPAEYRDKPAPFPETAEGQREFLDEVNRIVLATPGGLGKGIFWWEPAVTGGLRRRGMFDDEGNALPVINVFDKYTRGKLPPRTSP
jgi:arabinogalactan endo-1,4-beta-galactosidase